MRPDEVLRAAATLILEGGWSQGEPARDADGRPVPLFVTGSSETGRAAPNPAARQFSVYGAVATVMYRAGANPSAVWGTLATRAADMNGVPHGGDNHVHPVIQFNETEGRTAAEVLAFLGACADELQGDRPAAPLPAPDPQFAAPLPADMVARVVREPAPTLREEFPAEPDPAGVRSALDRVGPNPFGG